MFGHDGVVAAARFLESWSFGTLHPLIARLVLKDVHDALDPVDQAYFRQSREARFGATLEALADGAEAQAAALGKALEPVRRTLAQHEWLGGGRPLFTDYIVFGSLMWLVVIAGRLPLEAEDAVTSWFERCRDLHGGLARQAKRAA